MISILTQASPGSIVFVGGGQMAMALVAGLIKANLPRDAITVVEPDALQRARVIDTFGIDSVGDAASCRKTAEVVIWAVKPQVMRTAVLQSIGCFPGALHVSIAAGITTSTLVDWLKTQRVIRAMPNTSALIGAGVTGLVASADVTQADRTVGEALLSATGHCFWVESDDRLNAVTAVSGSGPAYVFYFLESFQRGAQALGFNEEQARDLVLKTTAGALAQAGLGDAFDTLRTRVTSKGGTTQAALEALNSANVSQAVEAAMRAASRRSQEMAEEFAR